MIKVRSYSSISIIAAANTIAIVGIIAIIDLDLVTYSVGSRPVLKLVDLRL